MRTVPIEDEAIEQSRPGFPGRFFAQMEKKGLKYPGKYRILKEKRLISIHGIAAPMKLAGSQ